MPENEENQKKEDLVRDEHLLDESKSVFTLLKMGVKIIYPSGYTLTPEIRKNRILMSIYVNHDNVLNDGTSSLTPEGIIYVLQCKDQYTKQWIASGGDS